MSGKVKKCQIFTNFNLLDEQKAFEDMTIFSISLTKQFI